MIQFENEEYYTNWYLWKKFHKKEKTKNIVLLENDQPTSQCLVKRKNTDRILETKCRSAQYTK